MKLFNKLARKRTAVVILCGLLGVVFPTVIGAISGERFPQVHDEFSYLLAADTFASGRVTNPRHEFADHFESPHILNDPTYMSKYPPGQGLMIAMGQALSGYPILGIWISIGLGAAAVCWGLQGWTSSKWAFCGGLLFILRHGLTDGWAQSYWGGSVTAMGGALYLGGLRRCLDDWPRANEESQPQRLPIGSAIAMTIGIVILGITRPYEGAVFVLPGLLVTLVWLIRANGYSWAEKGRRFVLPVAVVLMTAGAGMAYYNYRVTGSATTMPYAVHHPNYFKTPLFVFQPENEDIEYKSERLKRHSDVFKPALTGRMYFLEAIRGIMSKQIGFYFGSVFVVTILLIPISLRQKWFAFALISWLLMVCAMSLANFHDMVHYAAAANFVTLLVIVEGLRKMRLYWRGGQHGRRFRARYVIAAALCVWLLWDVPELARKTYRNLTIGRTATIKRKINRWAFEHQLSFEPGKHLVIVFYSEDYPVHDEWVYNRADIDKAEIVWAHDRGDEANAELKQYFSDRYVWEAHLLPDKAVYAQVRSPRKSSNSEAE